MSATVAALLRVQADALEAQVRALRATAEALDAGATPPASSPRYATAKHNPIGSERGFKAAAGAGSFEVFKRGREIAARWEDVAAYVESRKRPVRAPAPAVEVDTDRTELEAAGVVLRPASPRARTANDRGRR